MKTLYPFDPSTKHHIIIGLLLAVSVCVFLHFTEYLNLNDLSKDEQFIYLFSYSFVAGCCYWLLLPFQNIVYRKLNTQWYILSEIFFIFFFFAVAIAIAGCYYLFIVANEPNFNTFNLMVSTNYQPAVAIILLIVLIGRFSFGKYYEKQLNLKKIEIKGEGQSEGLRILLNDIISIQSSDNSVEVIYLLGTHLKKKMIKTKLAVVGEEFPELLRAHRSFLINPFHFQRWKTENGNFYVMLNHNIEVPISKTYKDAIKAAVNATTN